MSTLVHVSESIDTSRYECFNGQLRERPLPNKIHSEVQLALVNLLRPQAKQIKATALQEWTLDRDATAAEWLTPDVLVASDSVPGASNGHALPPAILAVEIRSPQQSGLFNKAQILHAWGAEHVWIIDPFEQEYFEYRGGEQFTKVTTWLRAGALSLPVSDLSAA